MATNTASTTPNPNQSDVSALKSEAADAAEDAKSYTREKVEEVKSEASRLMQDGKEKASKLASDALESARSEAEARVSEARGKAAGEVDDFASSLRQAANSTRDGSLQAQALGQIADILANASDTIRDKDLNEIASDVTAYARQRPIVFFGAAALLGFAITRFAKASSAPQRTVYGNDADTVYPRTRS